MSVEDRSLQGKMNMTEHESGGILTAEDPAMSNKIRVGTRGSKLAIAQTELVIAALKRRFPDADFQMVILSTRGDRDTSRALLEFGGKAVFVEEFEEALLSSDIDIAVHSAKDMPMEIMEGLTISGTLPRACPQDVLIYKNGRIFAKNEHFVIGTSSLRRQYQILDMYPKAECRNLRGNVNTRLQKLEDGEYDAIILAAAGLERLGILEKTEMLPSETAPGESVEYEIFRNGLTFRYLSTEEMTPAACQGIIAIETRDSGKVCEMVKSISDVTSYTQLICERAVLNSLNAGCHEPIGVYSEISENGEHMKLSLMNVEENMNPTCQIHRRSAEGSTADWQKLVSKLINYK